MIKLTDSQIREAARSINIPYAGLKAIFYTECKSSGFNNDGTPVILFERHVFRQRLIKNKLSVLADKLVKSHPGLCNSKAGGYGLYSQQHRRLEAASVYDRTSALESASWGIGQVMGYQWRSLGYPSLQAFINAMYKDEASQLDAVCRYLVVNGIDKYIRAENWDMVAKLYNGSKYKENQYDDKLEAAYKQFS